MADAPWRCSQCDTVNEPNANACRSCGRWPSLFDLERGTLQDQSELVEEEVYRRDAPLPEELEIPVETVEVPESAHPVEEREDYSGVPKPEPKWPGLENPLDRPTQGWPKVASWIVPIIFLAYVVISIVANR